MAVKRHAVLHVTVVDLRRCEETRADVVERRRCAAIIDRVEADLRRVAVDRVAPRRAMGTVMRELRLAETTTTTQSRIEAAAARQTCGVIVIRAVRDPQRAGLLARLRERHRAMPLISTGAMLGLLARLRERHLRAKSMKGTAARDLATEMIAARVVNLTPAKIDRG